MLPDVRRVSRPQALQSAAADGTPGRAQSLAAPSLPLESRIPQLGADAKCLTVGHGLLLTRLLTPLRLQCCSSERPAAQSREIYCAMVAAGGAVTGGSA